VLNSGRLGGLTHKHQTRLERLARDKHSSLLIKKFFCTFSFGSFLFRQRSSYNSASLVPAGFPGIRERALTLFADVINSVS
jgi:hypothetical protein